MSDSKTPLPPESPDETFITSPRGDVPTQSSLNPVENTSSGAARPAAPVGMVVDVGGQLGPYQLVAKLGEGGMGAVFKARHTKLGKLVALKILPPHVMSRGDALARFEREMLAVGSLQHPNIVQAHDAGDVGGVHYLSMEFVEGQDLQKVVQDKGPMSVVNACKAIRQAAQGLAAAHKLGLVHRDIKPSNLFVTKQTGQIKILDMGLALLSQEQVPAALTSTGQCFGTPDYMAPEQWSDAHTCDGRADLYSLGCTLFYLLVGHPPYPTETHRSAANKMKGHVMDPAPDLRAARPDVPEELDAIYRRLMAKLPEDRFESASELAEALAPFSTRQGATTFRDRGSIPASDSLPATAAAIDVTRERTTPNATAAADPFSSTSTWGPGANANESRTTHTAPSARSSKRWLLAAGGAAALLLVLFLVLGVIIAPTDQSGTRPKGTLQVDSEAPVTTNGDAAPEEVQATSPVAKVAATTPMTPAGDSEELPATFTNRLGMPFVKAPKGTGWLGGRRGVPGDKAVSIDHDFYLGTHPVTQGEWEQLMGNNPSQFSRFGTKSEAVRDLSDQDLKRFPVEFVSWDDAESFVQRLNAHDQQPGWVYRLPTEVEWEYACRGGPIAQSESAFEYYLETPSNVLLPAQANFGLGDDGRPCAVGSYKPNPLGLHDMHGNVHVWCADRVPAPDKSQTDSHRVLRGGSYWSEAPFCRATTRFVHLPSLRHGNAGLRVARVRVEPATSKGTPPAPSTTAIDFAAERQVAEWVRTNNGILALETIKGWINLAKDQPLPSELFVIRIIDLRGIPMMTDDDMLRISRCQSIEELTLLGAPKLTPKSISSITQLPRLKLLNLNTPAIPTSALAELSKVSTLDLLKITGDMIDDRLKFLQQLPELRRFHIYDWRPNRPDLSLIPEAKGLHDLELALTNLPPPDELAAIKLKHGRLRILFGFETFEVVNPDPVHQAAKALIGLGVECHGNHVGSFDSKRLTVADLDDGKPWYVEARKAPASVRLSEVDRRQLVRLTMQHFTAEGQREADQLAEILVQSKSLCSVTLNDSDLTDAGLAHFQKLPSLRHVIVKNTKVTAAGIQELRRALPSTFIASDFGEFPSVQVTAMKAQSQPRPAP